MTIILSLASAMLVAKPTVAYHFLPSTCRRTFRLSMTDHVAYLVLSNLIAEVHRIIIGLA